MKCMKCLRLLVSLFAGTLAYGVNLTLPSGGKVTVELVFSDADFTNTMSLIIPPGSKWGIHKIPNPENPSEMIKMSGCVIEPSVIAVTPGEELLSEKRSQRGCRVQLDADLTTAGIQGFPAGTVLQFAMCAIANGTPPVCDFIWSSDPTLNNGTNGYSSDTLDHLRITPIVAGKVFELEWEDLPGGADFNDLIARVSVDADTDGDGLWDDWEDSGVDTNGDGTADVILSGSDKYRKDIFLILDYMNCAVGPSPPAPTGCAVPHSHEPTTAAIDKLKAAFNDAPVPNVYGMNVRPDGIELHVEIGSAVRHSEFGYIPGICNTPTGHNTPPEGNLDNVKSITFPQSDGRRFTHRYGLLAHDLQGRPGSTGCGELPGNDFIVTLGNPLPAATPAHVVATRQSSTIMHELGHTLGLQHGGDEPINGKPNYISVMNYSFQKDGIPQILGGPARIDYSPGGRLTLTEVNAMTGVGGLSEPNGIGLGSMATSDMTRWACPPIDLNGDGEFESIDSGTGSAGGSINWDCAGTATATNFKSDLNGDQLCIQRVGVSALAKLPDDQGLLLSWIMDGNNRICDTAASGSHILLRQVNPQPPVLKDFDDWEHLVYDFQTSVNFDHGVHLTESPDPEPDLVFINTFLGPEPALTTSGAVSGSTVTYTMQIKNNSTSPATNVVLSDVLPAQIAAVTCVASAGGVCGGSGNNRTVSFGAVAGGNIATVTFTGQLGCVPAGTTTTIVNTARITADQDRKGGNNIASASVSARVCTANSLPVSINQSVVTFNRPTGRYLQTVTLTNTGSVPLADLAYVADYLPAGVVMFNRNGVTSATSPTGSPYKNVGAAIPAGGTVTLNLEFTRTGTPAMTYVPRVLGPGAR